ncbi:hypothetical protein GGI24_004072 [Coemansia furcata]|nr:hypothetical protein GGI24_004072 [Coemansia furcata]
MDSLQPRRDGASPQSVPTLYPNFDLSSASGLIQPSTGAMLADHDPLLGVASSGLTAGFSNDMLSGIQLLASNQNISTGSFMNHLFDSPGLGASSMVPTVSPGGMHHSSRSSQVASSTTRYGDRDSRSPSVSTTAATPGDMFVPLSTISGSGSAGSIFGMDSFQNQNGFAQLASLIQQSSSPTSSHNPAVTPSLSDLFTMSPSHVTNDGLISFIPPALTTAATGNGLTTGMFSMANTGPAVSLPTLLQQSAAYQVSKPVATSAVTDTNMLFNGGRSSSPVLPARLMAYRNPDPLLAADDGDSLEKLLLSSMQPVKPATPVEDAQPTATGEVLCTCCSQELTSCPKHGSPGDMSEEMREMAPQLLNFVCNETNTMADEELNDLCSLMYKHAKCSDIQKRVELVREKIKADSELEMFQTKQKLAKQYGLH